jgi:hypothetical protein
MRSSATSSSAERAAGAAARESHRGMTVVGAPPGGAPHAFRPDYACFEGSAAFLVLK